MGPIFKYYHYIALKSAFDNIKPWVIYCYTDTQFPMNDVLFKRAVEEFGLILLRIRDATFVHSRRIKQVYFRIIIA
jgi:hypothetical protein